jgi:hypothetical protein
MQIARIRALLCLTRRFSSFGSTTRKAANGIKPSIVLSDEEERLFDKFRSWSQRENLNVTLRVVGGWVRDRLLGKTHTVDVDLVMDTMNPVIFLNKVNKWNLADGRSKIQFKVIKRNPRKLKFVEPGDIKKQNLFGFYLVSDTFLFF